MRLSSWHVQEYDVIGHASSSIREYNLILASYLRLVHIRTSLRLGTFSLN